MNFIPCPFINCLSSYIEIKQNQGFSKMNKQFSGKNRKKKRIGFTTTIPVEIPLSAGLMPVDLNNIFVTHPKALELMLRAEADGYPRSLCSWIKGIYGAIRQLDPVDQLIIVTEGDCSNTRSMMETLEVKTDLPLFTFNYPHNRDPQRLKQEMQGLAKNLGTTIKKAEEVRTSLEPLREKLRVLDEISWKNGKVSGGENHLWLVSSSDFNGDPVTFEKELDAFLEEANARPPSPPKMPLAFVGVPPIYSDLYSYLSDRGARVVLNEMQRQFSMPNRSPSLLDQYLSYTYPYDVFFRLRDLEKEIEKRGVKGAIHYVQSFCHRGIEDIILRENLNVPVLTLEGDAPGALDAKSRLRIDIFLEMLSQK